MFEFRPDDHHPTAASGRISTVVVLLLVVALFAAACSSAVTVSGEDPTATADGAAGQSADDAGTDAGTDEDAGSQSSEPSSPEPTQDPTPQEPEVQEAPTPTPEPELSDADAELVEEVLLNASGATSSVERCVTTEVFADGELVTEVLRLQDTAQIQDLPPESQTRVIEIAAGCMTGQDFAFAIVDGFVANLDDDVVIDPAIRDCLVVAFADEQQQLLFAEAMFVPNDASPEATAAVVDSMSRCVDGATWAALFRGVVSDRAALDGFEDAGVALDDACLAELFDDADFERNFVFQAYSEADFDSPEGVAALAPMFSCVAFGAIFAQVFADRGVELSQSSIECLDRTAREEGLLERLAAGEQVGDGELGAVLLPCLSANELSQIVDN